MSALPQIFAPQSPPQAAPSRAPVSDAPQPSQNETLRPRDRNSDQARADSQSTDRKFDDAMSEQEEARAPKDTSTSATAPSRTVKTASSEESSTPEAPTENISDLLFTNIIAAAPKSNVDQGSEGQVPELKSTSQTPVTVKDGLLPDGVAIEAPLPGDVVPVEAEDAAKAADAEAKPDTPALDIDVEVKPAKNPADTTNQAELDPSYRLETGGPVEVSAEETGATRREIIQSNQTTANATETTARFAATDDAIQTNTQATMPAETDNKLPITEATPKPQTNPEVRTDSHVETGPDVRRTTADADLQAIRADRASATISMTDAFPDPDRLMPVSNKPLPLSALADTVSLPGLSQALPASTPLTPISGLSERLAATILQTTQSNPTVTLDKLPQTVVAVSLSSRSATIQIDPPELGRIQLDYQFDSQGRTVVTLTPESEAARAALVDRMATITAALEQGSASGVDVKLGDAQDFGTTFSDASDGEAADGDRSGSSSENLDASATHETPLPVQGHHIAEDGTSRLHMRV